MTVFHLATHNQGDKAVSPNKGWDAECLTERSKSPAPEWAERYKVRALKGLAIDWNPDVIDVRAKHWQMAHCGAPKFSPNRGTIWIEGSLVVAPWIDVAVMCSHMLNDPDGSTRIGGIIRRVLWRVHRAQDRRIAERLIRRGFLVLFGGDINDHQATLEPLVRELTGHYDAIGYSADKRLRFEGIETSGRGGSDHQRFTATFNIGK